MQEQVLGFQAQAKKLPKARFVLKWMKVLVNSRAMRSAGLLLFEELHSLANACRVLAIVTEEMFHPVSGRELSASWGADMVKRSMWRAGVA